jgi:hypothetical protein
MDLYDLQQTYVFENTEVKLTSRTAIKKLPSGKDDILYEITPVDMSYGTWKKWVRTDQLYKII